MSETKFWFAPKRYGIGTGWPITWQGWLLDLTFVIGFFAGVAFLFKHPRMFETAWPAFVVVFMLLAVVRQFKTRGRLRWRWGETDD